MDGRQVRLVVESTEVQGSMFPMLDGFLVPVQDLVERLRGAGATTVTTDVLFVDNNTRVMRTQDGEIFVYGRV